MPAEELPEEIEKELQENTIEVEVPKWLVCISNPDPQEDNPQPQEPPC